MIKWSEPMNSTTTQILLYHHIISQLQHRTWYYIDVWCNWYCFITIKWSTPNFYLTDISLEYLQYVDTTLQDEINSCTTFLSPALVSNFYFLFPIFMS